MERTTRRRVAQLSITVLLAASTLGSAAGAAGARSGAKAKEPAPAVAALRSVQEQLAGFAAATFTEVLQDASDENISAELHLAVKVSEVSTDPEQCRLSYRRSLDRDDTSNEQQMQVALHDVEQIKTEPFESYSNEWEGKPGYVYTMTAPQMTAIVMVLPNHTVSWFVSADADAANRLAAALNQAVKACGGSAAGKN